MNRKLILFIALVACLALPLGHLAAQEPTPPAAAAPFMPPNEPNETFATAAPLPVFPFRGYFHTANDVDFYRFTIETAVEWDAVVIVSYDFAVLRVELALYSANQTLLAQDVSCDSYHFGAHIRATLSPGDYFLRVRPCAGTLNVDDSYSLYDSALRGNVVDAEPNDTLETATPVTIGQVVVASYDPLDYYGPCDDDWYRFQGRAGDVFRFIEPTFPYVEPPFARLYDANGNWLRGQIVLPADGIYYLKVLGEFDGGDDGDPYCYEGAYSFTVGESLWISVTTDGLGGDSSLKRGDIVTRKNQAGKWQLVFDASDVGITANVNAIQRMPNGTILMSLAAAQNVPGLGKVMPHDIIRFVPTSLGANTAGTFEWFLDGSDVGLTTAGERIDAINVQTDGGDLIHYPLNISITGTGSVPRQSGGALTVRDETVINLVQTSWGANSAGGWRTGQHNTIPTGLAQEDINALERLEKYPQGHSVELLVLLDNFTINGDSGGPKDIFDLENGIWVHNLADKNIDALTSGPAQP